MEVGAAGVTRLEIQVIKNPFKTIAPAQKYFLLIIACSAPLAGRL